MTPPPVAGWIQIYKVVNLITCNEMSNTNLIPDSLCYMKSTGNQEKNTIHVYIFKEMTNLKLKQNRFVSEDTKSFHEI